jgi:hypothetical protein
VVTGKARAILILGSRVYLPPGGHANQRSCDGGKCFGKKNISEVAIAGDRWS